MRVEVDPHGGYFRVKEGKATGIQGIRDINGNKLLPMPEEKLHPMTHWRF